LSFPGKLEASISNWLSRHGIPAGVYAAKRSGHELLHVYKYIVVNKFTLENILQGVQKINYQFKNRGEGVTRISSPVKIKEHIWPV
jgi:hypothetical protein